jgi:hypothetical protein
VCVTVCGCVCAVRKKMEKSKEYGR